MTGQRVFRTSWGPLRAPHKPGAEHRIWLTSAVAGAAYDVTSWIELPPPGGAAPNLELDTTFTVRITP